MEEDLHPRLTPPPAGEHERRALRGFGFGLGLVLFFFAWRARAHGGALFGALSMASVLLALARPASFEAPYSLWMPVARVLARANLWLLCGLLYYLIVTPYGLLQRALGFSPLALKLREKDSYWEEKTARDPVESTRRIF